MLKSVKLLLLRIVFTAFIFTPSIIGLNGCQVSSANDNEEERKSGDHAHSAAGNGWWNIPYPGSFDQSLLKKKQDHISIQGTKFVDEKGQDFVFRGVNIADPDKLDSQGQWTERLFQEVSDWGSNTVRIPIHPIGWRSQGKAFYFERIDQAVVWANRHDLYIILDWHSIGNIEDELFQHPMYVTSIKETTNFWKEIALRYKKVSTIAVYEIFNEPTDNYIGTSQGLGQVKWEDWLVILEDNIDLIRAYDKKVIPLVSGFNWAYDLKPFKEAPVRRPDVAYAVHPYPMKAKPENNSKNNFFRLWEDQWGFMAETYPMIATEIGWVAEGGYGAHVPVINDGTYGPQIIEFMSSKDISWTAWAFDPEWAPVMIKDWDFTPSEQGAFFKKVMLEARKASL